MDILNTFTKRNFIFGVLLIGMALDAGIGFYTWTLNQKKIESEFKNDADSRFFAIEESIELHIQVLQSITSFYDASQYVSREEFHIFIQNHLQNYPSIQALEWIPKVFESNRREYELLARRDGLTDFQITEREVQGKMISAKKRAEYFPVYYVEPLEGNRAAVGVKYELFYSCRGLENQRS